MAEEHAATGLERATRDGRPAVVTNSSAEWIVLITDNRPLHQRPFVS